MNTKHIAEETAEQIETDVSDVIIDKALLTGIIQSAIEKATEQVCKERDAWKRMFANWQRLNRAARASEQNAKRRAKILGSDLPLSEKVDALIADDAAHASEDDAEQLARTFHETYERLAPAFNYDTRKESAKPWEQVPDTNRKLMIAVCRELLSEPWRCKTKAGAAHASEVEEQAWHDGTMSPEVRATVNRAAHASHYEIEAAKKLCELYFNIAAEVIGEDEVRKRRDAMIESHAAHATRASEAEAQLDKVTAQRDELLAAAKELDATFWPAQQGWTEETSKAFDALHDAIRNAEQH